MGLTDAMIDEDIDFIYDDLSETGATETVQRIPAGEKVVSGTFGILRAKQRTAEELMSSGFSTTYRFSFFAKRSDIGETVKGDVIVMANGDRVRVARIGEGPSRSQVMFDLKDEFEPGD